MACKTNFLEFGKILMKKQLIKRWAAAEIVANCFGSIDCDFRIWAWYCRHFDRRRIVDRAYFYASCLKCGEIRNAITAFQSWLQKEFGTKGGAA